MKLPVARGRSEAPRSKADLAKLPDAELRQLAHDLGIVPGSRGATIRAIEERGVANVVDKESRAGYVDPDENVDVDAQPIADSTLRSLPAGHPGQNTPVATLDKLRAPDEVDDRPTVDHRPQPENTELAKDVKDDFPPQDQVLAAPFDESAIEGKTREEVTGESASEDGPSDRYDGMSRDELYAEAQERDIEGRSTMGMDELKEALRDADEE
jgi:hypothetical protein